MNIQANLEQAKHMLVSEFLLEPYRFYTEADAVARFHQILDSDPVINLKVMSKDGFQVPLIHQEFPTFFRFDDKNPLVDPPIGSKLSRGHYDVVILNPSFVAEHTAETGKNRDIANTRNENIQPIKAVI